MRIALLVCWYGEYPWYFPYFLHTCAYNPTVDFLIVTDNEEAIGNKPDNVKIIHRTMQELKDIFTQQLGFEVCIPTPYKLCDFKPAYGQLFPDLFQDYDFWGHTDLDIIWGDIRGFMTVEVLRNHDFITCRHDFTAGYFTLYRNDNNHNDIYLKSAHYQHVFTHPENFWFDEFGPLTGWGVDINIVFERPDMFQSMTYVIKMAEKHDGLKCFFDFIVLDGAPGNIRWKNGKIYYKDQYEAMFYHMFKFKKQCDNKVLSPIPDEFCITDKTFTLPLYTSKKQTSP